GQINWFMSLLLACFLVAVIIAGIMTDFVAITPALDVLTGERHSETARAVVLVGIAANRHAVKRNEDFANVIVGYAWSVEDDSIRHGYSFGLNCFRRSNATRAAASAVVRL